MCVACRSANGMVADRVAISTPLSALMRAENSYLSKAVLSTDLSILIDQYVNPWKTTNLGKWLCNAEGQPFIAPHDADPDPALQYKEIQGNALMEAYAGCYQSIDSLKFDLQQKGLPHDKESIYQLLNSIREEVITEYLLQQKHFLLDYSETESENSPNQNRIKMLLTQAGVSKSSIQQFALGLVSAITGVKFSPPIDGSQAVGTILVNALSSQYSPFDSTIAGLLLIAGVVKNTHAISALIRTVLPTTPINTARVLASRGDFRAHELEMLDSITCLSSICRIPVIRHSGHSPAPRINVQMQLHKEEDSTAPFFDRKWRYIFAYRLSRAANKPLAHLHPEVIHFLAASDAHFKRSEGWATLDQFVFMNANINANSNDDKGTALHRAVSLSQDSVIYRLLAAGANPSIPNSNGDTVLHMAVYNLLDAHAKTNRVNSDGDDPLTIAIYTKFKHLIDRLLAAGANPNIPNKHGDTPLHMAVRSNNEFLVL